MSHIPDADAEGLAEDLGELAKQLQATITKLGYLGAGKADSYARQTQGPEPTLAGAAAEAVAIAKSIEHYAGLYVE